MPYRLKEDLRVTVCCGSALGHWPGISAHGKVRPLFTWDRAIMGREGDGFGQQPEEREEESKSELVSQVAMKRMIAR